MKSREELDQIARDLVDEYFNSETQSLGWLQAQIVQALSRVQDEALNSVLPSIEQGSEAFYKHVEAWGDDTVSMRSARATSWHEAIVWFIANMKPAPQAIICTTRGYGKHQTLINELKEAGIIAVEIKPAQPRLSNEELETLALKHVEEKDWIHNENRRALGDAIMTGYRACEERLLGIKK